MRLPRWDLRLAAFHNGYAGVCRTQVNADNFSHNNSSLKCGARKRLFPHLFLFYKLLALICHLNHGMTDNPVTQAVTLLEYLCDYACS